MADPINEILPFGLGPDENVIEQAIYDELAARLTGFPKGLLPSAQINKVLRQGAFVASALAQLVAVTLGQDVLDDGDRDALTAKIIAAVVAIAGPGGVIATGTLLGNNTGSPAVPFALTAAQAKVLLAIAYGDVSGLGTAAQHPASDFDAAGAAGAVLASSLQKSQNLADLPNAGTARTNLGLGSAALSAATAFDASGAASAALAAAIAASQPRAAYAEDAAANHDLAAGDLWNLTGMTNGSANTITVRPDSAYNPAVNSEAHFGWKGVGQPTFVAGLGVTILAAPGLKLSDQGSIATLKKIGANSYWLFGRLSA